MPVEALRVLWGLEERVFAVRLADDGTLLVSPKARLTDDDYSTIRRHRDDLSALVAYCDEVMA